METTHHLTPDDHADRRTLSSLARRTAATPWRACPRSTGDHHSLRRPATSQLHATTHPTPRTTLDWKRDVLGDRETAHAFIHWRKPENNPSLAVTAVACQVSGSTHRPACNQSASLTPALPRDAAAHAINLLYVTFSSLFYVGLQPTPRQMLYRVVPRDGLLTIVTLPRRQQLSRGCHFARRGRRRQWRPCSNFQWQFDSSGHVGGLDHRWC